MADKGLKSNVVSLFGGTLLGISSVAPAYVLTITLGVLAVSVGEKIPVVLIAGFLPMFFAAYAYREFNRIMPDAGTAFTWTSKAFGPYIGWLGGWAAVLATIIVLSNLAELFRNFSNFIFKFLFPLLGGLGLFFVLVITLPDSASPDYGSGASIGGIGLVLILGVGLILIGLVFMFIMRARQPAFFRGETIKHESAHAMRPHEHLVS